MNASIESALVWQHGLGCAAHYDWLSRRADRLVRWDAAPFESSHTDCFAIDGCFWIWQPGVGGVRFSANPDGIEVFSERGVDRKWFAHLVRRCWFPPIYQVRGRQVVHASAVLRTSTGRATIFAGPSGAGKSTIAFGVGQRPGWHQLSDDAVAFSPEGGDIALHAIDSDPRLRPASARFFMTGSRPLPPLVWPDQDVGLERVYFLEPRDCGQPGESPVSVTRLRPAEAYRRLLTQAHALTLKLPALNQRLMLDYLAVASTIPAYQLVFRRSFDHIDALLDVIEHDSQESPAPSLLAAR